MVRRGQFSWDLHGGEGKGKKARIWVNTTLLTNNFSFNRIGKKELKIILCKI